MSADNSGDDVLVDIFGADGSNPYYNKFSAQGKLVLAISLIGLPLCIPPLILHYRHRNFPAIILVTIALLDDLVRVVNALLWPTDNVTKWWNGRGLCDVEVHYLAFATPCMGGCLTCILTSLAQALNPRKRTVGASKTQRRWKRAYEVTWCVVLPGIATVMMYFAQDVRYVILGIEGCAASYQQSIATLFLVQIWPFLFLLPALFFCILTVYRLYKHYRDLKHLISTSSHKHRARFIRLLCLCIVLLCIYLPLQTYVFVANVEVSVSTAPYSFSKSHSPGWSSPKFTPSFGQVRFSCWFMIVAPYIIFILFGIGKDAVKLYKQTLEKVGLGWVLERCRGRNDDAAPMYYAGGSQGRLVVKKEVSFTTHTNGQSTLRLKSYHQLSAQVPNAVGFDHGSSSEHSLPAIAHSGSLVSF
ncbi:a-factor receptor [Ascosphaera atra]|nr:a-factor receptor [Ascosphaera atra]